VEHYQIIRQHALVEHLAENAHEVWARKRLSEGWTYGPEKNAERKQTPWLVSYSALPEAEQDTDRQVSTESVKAAYALGWHLEPPLPSQELATLSPDEAAQVQALETYLEQERRSEQRSTTFDFDMNDQPELEAGVFEPFPVLKNAIAFLQQDLYPIWCKADADALRQQKRHRWIALCAIFAGVAAIVLAVVVLALKW